MRLNRYIASCTTYSRRQADDLVRAGRITINGSPAADLSFQVSIEDEIVLDGKLLTPHQKVYYVLNKPIGYTSTTKDPHAKKIVTDLVPKQPPVFPVGRLDVDSHGLMILTNDGALAHQITHPSFEHEKEYLVELKEDLTTEQLNKLAQGIDLEECRVFFDKIVKSSSATYAVTIHQGLNRQIRRMMGAVDAEVVDLKRIRIAQITLGGLPEGKYINMDEKKITKLLSQGSNNAIGG